MICGSGGSKSRLAKAAGAEPAGQMREMKNCTPLWREAHFQVKMYKTHHFQGLGPLLEVEMSKKCTPLWREAHFQVKMYKTHQVSDHFWKCEKVMWRENFPSAHQVSPFGSLWREAHFQVKMYKTHHVSDHFWKLRCRKSARRCGAKHISKSKCTKHYHVRTTFGGSDVEKVHAVVARSTFRSTKCYITPQLRCRKSRVPLFGLQMSLHYTTLVARTHYELQLHN